MKRSRKDTRTHAITLDKAQLKTPPRTRAVTHDPWRAQPWEVDEHDRPALLAWFLDADLAQRDVQDRLLDLTGRALQRRLPGARRAALQSEESRRVGRELISRGVAEDDVIYPGREWGQWKIAAPMSRSDFVRIYGDLQRYLREAKADWVRAMAEPDRGQRELFAYNALNRFRQERGDVMLDVLRDDDDGHVIWPKKEAKPVPVRRSGSLAGELALALYDELLGAKDADLCAHCRRPWVSPLKKKGRVLCGRDECRKAWRQAHRKPEDPATNRKRVKAWRAQNRWKLQDYRARKRAEKRRDSQ